MTLVRVLSPESEPECRVVAALLEAHDIPCFVHNGGFAALYPGPRIHAYNTSAIMVPEAHAEDALELIREFQKTPGGAGPCAPKAARLRMIIELLLFGWFVPGRTRAMGQ